MANEVQVVIRGIDQTTGVLKGIKGGLLGLGAAALGATVAVAGFSASSLDDFVKFDKSISEVFTLLPHLSQDAFDQMSADAREWSKELGVLTQESVPALYQAISAGVPPENVFDFMTVAQKAAIGGVTQLETAVDGITSVVSAYGAEIISATEASDLMFTAVKLGKTDFSQLSGSLFNVIPTAAALGVEFGDITAALAAMTAQGTPTAVATTQLRQMIIELSKSGSKTAKVFEGITKKTFAEFISSGGNVADALELMFFKAEATNKPISDLFSSVEAGNAALALTGKGAQRFRDNLDEMTASTGATDVAFEVMEKTASRSIERLGAKFEFFKLAIGEKLEPGFSSILLALEPIVENVFDNLISWFDDFGAGAERAFDILRPALDNFALFWEQQGPSIVQTAGEVFDTLSEIFQDVANEVVPFLTEQFELFSEWFVENGPLISEFLAVLGEAFRALAPVVVEVVGIILPLVSGMLDLLLAEIKFWMQVATDDWDGAWETMKEGTIGVLTSILASLWAFFDMVTGWFGSSGEQVVAVWLNNWNMMHEIARKLGTIIGSWIKDKLDEVTGFFAQLKSSAESILDGMVSSISSRMSSAANAFNGIIDQIKDVIQAFKDLAAAAFSFKMPSLLTPGSPTPFEMGLRGINDAMRDINAKSFPKFATNFGAMDMPSHVGGMAGGANVTIVYAPQVSFGTAAEFEENIIPLVEKSMRKIQGFA